MRTTVTTPREEQHPPPTTRRDASQPGSGIHLQVSYPGPRIAVITITGAIDDASLPRLAELVQQRLTSMIDVLVMDLSAVTFISVSGLALLRRTSMHAGPRGIALQVVATTHAVLRALRVVGLREVLECHGSVPDALAPPAQAHSPDLQEPLRSRPQHRIHVLPGGRSTARKDSAS